MIHADNKGLVLPPRAACIQVIIVPCGITVALSEQGKNQLQSSCDALEAELAKAGVKVKGDYRGNYSPGWKFNHWELKVNKCGDFFRIFKFVLFRGYLYVLSLDPKISKSDKSLL